MTKLLFNRKEVVSVVVDKHCYWLESNGKLYIHNKNYRHIDIPKKYQAMPDGQPSLLVYQSPYLYLTDKRGFIFSAIKNDELTRILDFSQFKDSNLNATWKPNFEKLHTLTQVFEEKRRYVSLNFDNMMLTEHLYPHENYMIFSGCNYYIAREKNEKNFWGVAALEPSTGEKIWQFNDFLNLGIDQYDNQMIEEVELILGIADELLWVKLKYGRLVGLDVATGLCNKEVRTTDIDTTDFSRSGNECDGPPWNSPIFVEEESGIVSLSYSRYAEIDLTSEKPVWICFDVKQEFDEKGLYAGGIKTHHQGSIYFSESMSGVFGVFDRSSKKIVWSDDLKNHNPDAGMVFEMRATDTNLYIQDNKQNLYVFEHEDNGRSI